MQELESKKLRCLSPFLLHVSTKWNFEHTPYSSTLLLTGLNACQAVTHRIVTNLYM